MTLTLTCDLDYEPDLDRVKLMNHCARYIGHRSFRLQVIVHADT